MSVDCVGSWTAPTGTVHTEKPGTFSLGGDGASGERSNSSIFHVFFAALSEMESTLLSVVKDRKSQGKKSVFVDALLQSTLTERQVKASETSEKIR